jgi:hypothetical protein
MNEIAVSISRPSATPQLRLPIFRVSHQSILLYGLCTVALLLAVTTGRNADQVPGPASARIKRVLVAANGNERPYSPSAMTREATGRSAMLRSKADTARIGNRFEPETAVDGRRPVAVVGDPTRRAFDGPMWRFLLNEPVRPDIDLTHNQTYFGVSVTLPFGG